MCFRVIAGQNGAGWKGTIHIEGCYAQGMFLNRKTISWNTIQTLSPPQVTETKALIEKHYYRIDVIEKVLAKKAMEEEER